MMDLWAIVPYYTAYLSKALRAEGADVMVGSITYYLDPTCFTSRGIKVDPGLLDIVGRFKLPQLLRRGLKLAEALVNMAVLVCRFAFSPPDVVHIQYLPMLRWRVPLDLWFLEFCRWRGARLVLTVHDLLPHDTAEVYRTTFQKLYGMVDGVICHSEHIKARLSEDFSVDREIVAVIPHGPFFYDLPVSNSGDVLRRLGVDKTKTLVLWQGIIFPYKGIDLLLDAWRMVELNDPDAVLIIAGTGAAELLRQIEQEIASNKLHHVMTHFRFVTTEELVALYRAADVVVYPYRAISTSGALATGLALGKCIVASNLPVFRELLVNGTNALLVDPTHREDLAAALLDVIGDRELRKRLSERVIAMNFGDASWHVIAQQTQLFYDYLLLRLNVI